MTESHSETHVGMACPTCGGEVKWDDYYGHITGWNELHNEPIISHEGDIYRCQNEDCQAWSHIFGVGELQEGYPC